jgi:hypothetical protein
MARRKSGPGRRTFSSTLLKALLEAKLLVQRWGELLSLSVNDSGQQAKPRRQ